ncbi:HAD family phosphatase [Thermomicrobium sp. 4228-Ro]|uniref:HAD family hydrolase n=1 Tax=Thermomicrobium sp. 4228-Ro TaxID=2993937 RepID=UPI002248BF26|nr:HAD family phosphatase [Thermomicrobium sp. 4228-Ro]MCX2726673.1 HAD family phosphatase [Thermomicrobium sp. 4228-Ro]
MAERIAAVVFDLDGVLVDSEALQLAAWQCYVERWEKKLPATLLPRLFGRRLVDAASIIVEELGLPVAPDEAARERDALFLASLPGNVRPMPGAHELITGLRERGMRLGLATSGHRRYVQLVLVELGLADAFAAVVTGDDVARGKPAPDCYRLAASRLGVSPAACIAIEDAPLGVAAARAAGLRCIAVPNAHTAHLDGFAAADTVLPGLDAVLPWLESNGWIA